MKYFAGLPRRFASTLVCAIVLTLLSPSASHAQTGVKITSIEVQYTGPETISRQRILAQLRTAVGRDYSDTVAEQDIRNLYATGQVQNVRIFGQPQGQGVKVIVAVQTRALVNEIEIEGASRISAKSLRKKIKLKVNAPVDEDALGKAKQEIVDAYRAKGFNDIDVQYRIDTNDARGTSRVVYTINEGMKGAVSDIEFEGNRAYSGRVLRKQMKTKRKSLIAFLDKSGRLDESQLNQDLDSVREWYQDHGYIDVVLGDVRRVRSGGRMTLVIPVTEGPKYFVGHISVKGAKMTTEEKVKTLMKLKEGGVYSPKTIREDAKKISEGYGSGGYVDLVVTPQGTPNSSGRIDVTFNIEEGERSFVQRINITGNTRTKDKVIRREVLIAPGDIYNTVRVETTKKRLDNLGYFSRVETYPQETGVNGRKDLVVEVEEKRTGSLNFGAGFSTVDSVVGFAEITQGNFDITNWPNFTGGGQKFRTRVQYGSQRKDFVVSLTEPYFLDRPLSLGGEAYYREASFLSTQYDQRNFGFSITVRKPITRFLSSSLEYRLEEIDIYNLSSNVSAALGAERGSRVKSQITPSLVFDRRDNPFLTRTGQRISFTPFVSGGFLGGDTQLYGFDLQASQYFKLPYDLILLLNGEVAGVDSWGNGTRVPIFDRLFLGGANDLRGFNYRDVSPKDSNNEPLGGRTLARGTIELTFPIIEKVRAAVFYDAGFVEEGAFDYSGKNMASDAGVGLRLDLPIGPIRIDYGIPIQAAGNSTSGHFNFNVGYQF
ncbi:MAG: outer membrane protein assembly factor BamA [Verrucomicrobiota bacterium]|nr:outer membrane protein assembly factor BamA [Verrucomicrobiota bacterium]